MDSTRSDGSIRRRRRASGRHARRAPVEKRAPTRQPPVGGRKDRRRSHLGHGGGAGAHGGGVSGGGLTVPAKWRGGTGGISAPRRRGEGVRPRQISATARRGKPPRAASVRKTRARRAVHDVGRVSPGRRSRGTPPPRQYSRPPQTHLRFLSMASSRLSLRIWIIPSSRLRRASSASMAFLKLFLRASVRDEGRSMVSGGCHAGVETQL
jgi:hypothetical protein